MIAISYFWIRDNEFDTEIFETEEEAKEWLIKELVDNRYINLWYDDVENKYFETRNDIRKCLEKYPLSEIVECSEIQGELHVIMKVK